MGMQRVNESDVEEVEEVTTKIQQMLSGEIAPEELDEWEKKRQGVKAIRTKEMAEMVEKGMLYGRPGKGEKTDYKWFCKRCFTEYYADLAENKCTKCKADLMTQEARRAELFEKLDDMKKDKVQRHKRRDKWIRWKKSQRLLSRSRNVNYQKWEYWEPDSDEEEAEPIVPKDNPEFQAMERDILDRKKKQVSRRVAAEACKVRGNECLKGNDLVGAIQHYEEGIEFRRDFKQLWTNKALAEVRLTRFDDAVQSCSKVLEYCEIFEDGFVRSRDPAFKAFVRRAQAYRGLHQFEEAVLDLREAVKLFPNDQECRSLLERTEETAVAAKQAAKVSADQAAAAAPAKAKKVAAVAAVQDAEAPEAACVEAGETAAPEKVRVEIEEESDDDEDLPKAAILRLRLPPALESLEELCDADYLAVAQALEADDDARLFFAQRREHTRRGKTVKSSFFDVALRDLDTAAMLVRKEARAGTLDADGRKVVPLSDDERKRGDVFRDSVAPRALRLVNACLPSSFCCDLAAHGARAIVQLFRVPSLQHSCAHLLEAMSLNTAARKSVGDAFTREEASLEELVVVARKKNENTEMIRAIQEAEKMGMGEVAAMMKGIVDGVAPLNDLALTVLSNICLDKKAKAAVQQTSVLETLSARLGALNQIAGLVTNMCGIDAQSARLAGDVARIVLPAFLPAIEKGDLKVIGAVQNLAFTSGLAREQLQEHQHLFRKVAHPELGARFTAILVKLLQDRPQVADHHLESLLVGCEAVLGKDPASEHVGNMVRLLGVLLAKTRALDVCGARLASLTVKVAALARKVGPTAYGSESQLRGNLALVVSTLAQRQADTEAPAVVQDLDLKPFVAPMVEWLRKDTGATQTNCGVAVTRLAQLERYKPAVRALNGFESLQQITLQAQRKTDMSIPAAFRH